MSAPTSENDDHGRVETPATFEELGELTFAEALEAFDDRYEEHASEEAERVRRQSDPNWAQEVLAKRAERGVCGVKFSDEALAKPPQPYPVADYSRKWELEHDLLETRSYIKSANELIDRFRARTADHRHYFGVRCTLEQAIKTEQDRIKKWEEEDVKPLEWELAWLKSSTAFDFTGKDCQSDPEAIHDLLEEGDALNYQLCVEQESRSQWFDLTKEQLTFLRKLDRAVYHAGDAVLPGYVDGGPGDPLLQWMVGAVGNCSRLELVAAGREIAKRDPGFWPRLRDIGPTPGLLRQANHILRGAGREEGPRRKAAAVGSQALYLLPRTRARAGKCSSPRVRGSRRVTSRSAGDGRSGEDPPPGEPEPARRRGLQGETQSQRANSSGSFGEDPHPKPEARMGTYGFAGDRTLWDIAVTSFGALIGGGAMGSEGMLVGGVVAYLWGCRRWHLLAARIRRG